MYIYVNIIIIIYNLFYQHFLNGKRKMYTFHGTYFQIATLKKNWCVSMYIYIYIYIYIYNCIHIHTYIYIYYERKKGT